MCLTIDRQPSLVFELEASRPIRARQAADQADSAREWSRRQPPLDGAERSGALTPMSVGPLFRVKMVVLAFTKVILLTTSSV
ncbi:unnamed protein product [Protopolystoma xenopodis]|uniref:Uncharacterized protein n=1 Tax=Protopolystoma xenopodis TaxID=117903 RepID=A0A448XSJ3_9PLAT|nr:unnamed protein product [Protopolystoma xenopodis]